MNSLQTLDYVFLFLYIVEQLVKVVRQGYSRGTLRGTRAARQGSAAYQSRAWSPAMPSMASGGIGQNRRRSQVRGVKCGIWAKLSACGWMQICGFGFRAHFSKNGPAVFDFAVRPHTTTTTTTTRNTTPPRPPSQPQSLHTLISRLRTHTNSLKAP